MGASAIPILAFTIIWGIVGIGLPFFVPKGPNRGILQVILVMTAFTCWLFWLCCYMAQMNPLIGPKLDAATIKIMAREWVTSNILIATIICIIVLPTIVFDLTNIIINGHGIAEG